MCGKNRYGPDENRRTITGMIRYNTGMETEKHSKTEKSSGILIGTAMAIGGFLCALLLTRVRLFGLHMPLAMGLLLGCQLAGFEPAAVVSGIILGTFADTPLYWQGTAIALLYWAVTRVIFAIRKKCPPMIRFLVFMLSSILTLPLSAQFGTEALLYGLVSAGISAVAGLCFRRICLCIRAAPHIRIITDAAQGAIVLGIGMLLLAMSDAAFSGWSLAAMLMLLLTAIAVSVRGVFGAAAGILWSVMLSLYTGADAGLIGNVALGALAASAVRKKGKPFIIGAFFLSGIVFQTYRAENAYAMNAANLLSGMLLFPLIPKNWITLLQAHTDPHHGTERIAADAVRRTEQRASRELERMGKLLAGFSGMFRVSAQEDDAVTRWTVQGALAICQGCARRRMCWRDADAMRDAVLAIVKEAEEGKRVTPVLPMDGSCAHFSDFCASSVLAYRQACNRNAVSRRAQQQTGFVERQFSGAGEALCAYAKKMRTRTRDADRRQERIRDRLTEAGVTVDAIDLYETDGTDVITLSVRRPLQIEHAAVRWEVEQACGFRLRCIRVAQSAHRVSFTFEQDAELHAAAKISRMSDGPLISGDATGECRIPGGRVCFALSDGMGRGKEARTESEAAIRLLFRLCCAGVQKELVYENVNRMLLAQNEAEMYATLDAVSIDLNTGDAEMLKYGAPPSYLIRDGKIRTIAGEALPCGILAEAKPSVIRIKLKKHDRIVLCSDGVQDVLTEGTEQAIRSIREGEQKTGERLLRLARLRGGSDDMTVMVIDVA